MSFCCYIIYSKSLDRYYIGYTSDIRERLILHNSGYFGGRSYTSRSSDWEIYLVIPCYTIEQAIFLETKIKRMKSRRYVENLRKYPELAKKLKRSITNGYEKES